THSPPLWARQLGNNSLTLIPPNSGMPKGKASASALLIKCSSISSFSSHFPTDKQKPRGCDSSSILSRSPKPYSDSPPEASSWKRLESYNYNKEEINQNITDRNKANCSHQSMPYRKGRKSHYQLKDAFRLAHDREPNRVEIFKIGRCKELPDGNEQWVDDESRSRYEMMIQLLTPSLYSESGSTPISTEEAFVSVMGKDRSGRICCRGSRETRCTWYGIGEGPSSTNYQQQISNIENTLRMEVEELRTEACRRDSEMDEMRRELE
ncbi:hypothetical protein Taro_049186, partial [Colocasia esculenta]|nr:hypothetical protein [Colocasia esculenta]